jgi:hypothetical protein
MLAQHCRANQRELFMVTVLFYREETVEGSFRRSFELLEKLQSWLLSEGGDFFLSTVELHRVLPESNAEGTAKDDGFDDLSDGEEYPEEEVEVTDQPETGALLVGQGRKRRAVGRWVRESGGENTETRREVALTGERHLEGHAHLHLMVALSYQKLTRLKAFFSLMPEMSLDVMVRTVGGGTPSLEEYKPRTNIGGYTKQVVKGLRYVLKEHRIEEGEGLFRQLDRERNGEGIFLKFQCSYDGRVVELENFIRPLLQQLKQQLPSSLRMREMDPLERNFSFAPHSTEAEKVSQLLQYYLEAKDRLLFYHREVLDELRPPHWEVGLLKPVPGLGSQSLNLRVVTTETEEVYNRLRKFFQRWPPLKELLEKELRKSFFDCCESQTFYLPKRLLVRGFGSFYSLRDGTTVWYGRNQPLFRSWLESDE